MVLFFKEYRKIQGKIYRTTSQIDLPLSKMLFRSKGSV